MASSDDSDQLIEAFKAYAKQSTAGKGSEADHLLMNSKAAGKLAKDTMPKELHTRVDSSVFPVFKEKNKQHMRISKDTCEAFINKCAHEYCKVSAPKIAADDEKVKKKAADIRTKIISTCPSTQSTAISTKGNVKGLTDTSKYTGSHANRFDASGKGKGKDGREDLHEHTGYVGQYKEKDTYDKKH